MKIKENFFRDMARVMLYYLFPLVVKIIPVGLDFSFYRLVGRFFFSVGGKKRALIEHNLEMVFPDLPQEKIREQALRYFENHFIDRLQLFSFSRLNSANIHRYITLEGLEHLHNSLRAGKGCVLIHGHYGPAQLFIAGLALAGIPITQIGFVTKEGYSYIGLHVAVRRRLQLESLIPGNIFYADKFLKPIFRKLKNNEVIANAGDGTGGGLKLGKYIDRPFLNQIRKFPLGSISLAQRTGAALVPLLLSQTDDGRYVATFKPEIEIEAGQVGQEQAVDQFAALLATQLKQQPGLWHFWDEFPSRNCNM